LSNEISLLENNTSAPRHYLKMPNFIVDTSNSTATPPSPKEERNFLIIICVLIGWAFGSWALMEIWSRLSGITKATICDWLKSNWDWPGWIFIWLPNFLVSIFSGVPLSKYHSPVCLALWIATSLLYLVTFGRRQWMGREKNRHLVESRFWGVLVMIIGMFMDGLAMSLVVWDKKKFHEYPQNWFLASIILGSVSLFYSFLGLRVELYLCKNERSWKGTIHAPSVLPSLGGRRFSLLDGDTENNYNLPRITAPGPALLSRPPAPAQS
jgi:hypothetical protein